MAEDSSGDGPAAGGRSDPTTAGSTAGGDASAGEVAVGERARSALGFSRWWQLVAAAGMMAAVSPYQYVWSSIAPPLATRLELAPAALGTVFSLYVVFQSFSQFPAGWWRDRRGPAVLSLLAGLLAGGGYVGLAYATELWQLYVLYSLGSIGVGVVYTVAVNTAVKWFPDRTGLATGVGTMAFAAGSVLVVPYVRANATAASYPTVLRTVGLLILVVVVAGAVLLRDPPTGWLAGETANDRGGEDRSVPAEGRPTPDDGRSTPEDGRSVPDDSGPDDSGPDHSSDGNARDAASGRHGRAYTPRGMVATWQFWLLYAMFVAMAGADLVVIANVVTFAGELGFRARVATLAATLLPLAAGTSRLVLGEATDRFGRRPVMVASFAIAGACRLALVATGAAGLGTAFVVLVPAAMFFSSPLYVYFPAILSDYYGARHSSANYAVLYTAKVGGGVLAGAVAGYLAATLGWGPTFALGGGLAIAAGVAALALRPPPASRGATDAA